MDTPQLSTTGATADASAPGATAALAQALKQINAVVVGKTQAVQLCVAAILAEGHVLIEDLPGVGKTTLAHALARSFALQFQRIQFTSDLLPTDLIGVSVYRREQERFEFVPGPMFTELLLADELNRGSPKTQSALLEAMAEGQITADGATRALPQPFFVIATQNPQEQAGTFALPESQLDRFMFKLALGYPDGASERALMMGQSRARMISALQPMVSHAQLMALRNQARSVSCAAPLIDYVQRLVQGSRSASEVRFGLSPRAGLSLLAAAKAFAMLAGRAHVLPDDVQAVFVAAAGHRISVREGTAAGAQAFASALLQRTAVL